MFGKSKVNIDKTNGDRQEFKVVELSKKIVFKFETFFFCTGVQKRLVIEKQRDQLC